jgi:hypothetical protein
MHISVSKSISQCIEPIVVSIFYVSCHKCILVEEMGMRMCVYILCHAMTTTLKT